MYTVKYCPICKKNLPNPYCIPEYFVKCNNPKEHDISQFIDTGLTEVDFAIINDISEDPNFIESMIKLKEDDIIEYNLKMAQFRNQVQQQETIGIQSENTVCCPYCHSTNIHKISGAERAASIMGLGIFSKKINKSFKCNNCDGTF